MVFTCVVKGCDTVARNGLHSFPSNKLTAERWIIAIKAFYLMDRLNNNKLSHSYYKLCKKHFQESDFQLNGKGQRIVKPDSIPSLFLPNEIDESVPHVVPHAQKPVKRLQRVFSKSYVTASKRSTNKLSSNDDAIRTDNGLDMDIDVVSRSTGNEIPKCSTATTDLILKSRSKFTIGARMSKRLSYFRKKARDLQQKIKQTPINDATLLHYLSSKCTKQLLELIKIQLTNCGRPGTGRRYTDEQKSLCLAMYKQGPRSYRFKSKWCILPTKRTLGRYSADLIFKSGVDPKMFESIKNVVKDWPQKQKLCAVTFDEIALKEHLAYSQAQDKIEGFVEMNRRMKEPLFATHSLTFMVRGLASNYKQPVGHFYTKGIKAFELVELVQLMVGEVSTTGLEPLMSVCDQSNTNASAINDLVKSPSLQQTGCLLKYTINGKTIIHCYDPSHLIKSIRNNLETKNLEHYIGERWRKGRKGGHNGTLQIATWNDIQALFRKDLHSTERAVPKLTEEHLRPIKQKMKVSTATQVFSNTSGSAMSRFCQKGLLPPHSTRTAKFLLFVNDLFDSINCCENDTGSVLRSPVTDDSPHFEFWNYALAELPRMSYVDKETGEPNNRSSVLKKLESTIRGYRQISKMCLDSGIEKVNIRETTQDGLENFFGSVKSYNQNNKPTPTQYRIAYTTALINNISAANPLQTNCEPDMSAPILTNIHEFVTAFKNAGASENQKLADDHEAFGSVVEVQANGTSNYELNSIIISDPQNNSECEETLDVDSESNDVETNASNRIYQHLYKATKCDECKINFELMDKNEALFNIEQILKILKENIPHICYEDFLKRKLLNYIQLIQVHIIGCAEHNDAIDRKIKNLAVDDAIRSFCNNINKILSNKTQTLPDNSNNIEQIAFDHRKTKKGIGKFSDALDALH